MRVQTDIYKVYNFDELSEEVQTKVLNNFREFEDFLFLNEDLMEELARLLDDHKITYNELPKLYFSLSYSQGDGVMFEGTVYWQACTANITQVGRYYHYNSKEIELFYTKSDKWAKETTEEKFNNIYVEICKELEQYGYEQIEYMLSDKAIIETIEANEYEFTETGAIV